MKHIALSTENATFHFPWFLKYNSESEMGKENQSGG
jgi:hypothetical protein